MHLQLPKRVKEILEELGFIELQCYKPNPLMKQQPSLLFPRDEDKNTFLHLLGNFSQIISGFFSFIRRLNSEKFQIFNFEASIFIFVGKIVILLKMTF